MTMVEARKLNEPEVELRQAVNEIALSEVYRIELWVISLRESMRHG
jgi:hypothetical protein